MNASSALIRATAARPLGVDFLGPHRVPLAHSRQKIDLRHVGGTVFETKDTVPAASADLRSPLRPLGR